MADIDDASVVLGGDDLPRDHALIRRRDAAQVTLDRYLDKPFRWGEFDCGRMVAHHLRQFGIPAGLGKAGRYTTAIGARRALQRLGVGSIAEQLDRLGLARIAPAAALIGDLIAMPSEGPLDALAIAVGNGRVLGFHELTPGATVLQPLRVLDAWRVPA